MTYFQELHNLHVLSEATNGVFIERTCQLRRGTDLDFFKKNIIEGILQIIDHSDKKQFNTKYKIFNINACFQKGFIPAHPPYSNPLLLYWNEVKSFTVCCKTHMKVAIIFSKTNLEKISLNMYFSHESNFAVFFGKVKK